MKAREFWIQQTRQGKSGYWGTTVSNKPSCIYEESDFKEATNVIEKRAYDEAMDILKGTIASLDQIVKTQDKTFRDVYLDITTRARGLIE